MFHVRHIKIKIFPTGTVFFIFGNTSRLYILLNKYFGMKLYQLNRNLD